MPTFGMDAALIDQIRGLWLEMAGSPQKLELDQRVVVVGPGGYGICPDGWIGLVQVADSIIVQAPSSLVEAVTGRLQGFADFDELFSQDGAGAISGPVESVLGPATLFYGLESTVQVDTRRVSAPLDVSDSRVKDLLESVSSDEADESDLFNTDSGVIVAFDSAGNAASAGGYRSWPCGVAHLSVLTRADMRGQGFGAAAASAAVRLATSNGFLPQWRSADSNVASTMLAVSLGLAPVGKQLSFKLAES